LHPVTTRNVQNDFSIAGLAPELFVRDLESSLAFYTDRLGFRVVRSEANFAVLALGEARLQLVLLDESIDGQKEWLAGGPRGIGVNLRFIVDDVEAMYAEARRHDVTVVREPGDRFYGLRDFTIIDPDGFIVSFGSALRA
jgi:catechol 2,3-dioxygenase-like lactoylglutathione lyase family enzyme